MIKKKKRTRHRLSGFTLNYANKQIMNKIGDRRLEMKLFRVPANFFFFFFLYFSFFLSSASVMRECSFEFVPVCAFRHSSHTTFRNTAKEKRKKNKSFRYFILDILMSEMQANNTHHNIVPLHLRFLLGQFFQIHFYAAPNPNENT